MKFTTNMHAIETQQKSDCLVVAIFKACSCRTTKQNSTIVTEARDQTEFCKNRLSTTAMALDKIGGGKIATLLAENTLNGKIGETTMLFSYGGYAKVLLVGCGSKKNCDVIDFKKIVTHTTQALNQYSVQNAMICLAEINVKKNKNGYQEKVSATSISYYWRIRLIIEAITNIQYVFDAYKTNKKNSTQKPLIEVTFALPNKADTVAGVVRAEIEMAIAHGNAVAGGVNAARDLSNEPPNICTPAYMGEQVIKLVKHYQQSAFVKADLIDRDGLKLLNMNAYLAVGRGAKNKPMMSIIHYQGGDSTSAPIVLIGKGVTFDSGGISLKPGDSMDEMKYDMCGAATVYGVMHAVLALKLPLNVIGILAGCENMPDSKSYRPGDILTTLSGKTVEVLNTDAEGRLILCDVLTYVERFQPELVIDIATLTGAAIIALGHDVNAVMANNQTLAHQLTAAGEVVADQAWQLPLLPCYSEQIQSSIADIANIGGRPAGTITAGYFLSMFTEKYRWAHIDIAGTAWKSGKNKSATGRPVPLLLQFLLNQVHANSDKVSA